MTVNDDGQIPADREVATAVEAVRETFTDEHGRTWSGVRLVHVGPDGHDRLVSGETCECGWIKL